MRKEWLTRYGGNDRSEADVIRDLILKSIFH